MRRRLRDIGFPILVLSALAASAYLAATAHVPDPVPDYALQAVAVYRLEIGAACFAAFYLAAMALVLALDGRGFAEFGTRGLKVDDIVDRRATAVQEDISEQAKFNQWMEKYLESLDYALQRTDQRQTSYDQRLEKLERGE
ncbi:MAG: hypothetical protein ACTHN7_00370 [Solirubrobacterales bacterium]